MDMATLQFFNENKDQSGIVSNILHRLILKKKPD